MSQKVVLHNKSRREIFQVTLYHSIICEVAGECFCSVPDPGMPDVNGRLPQEGRRQESSFTILPGEYSEPLPPVVLEHPIVKKALEPTARWLEIANKLVKVQVFPGGK